MKNVEKNKYLPRQKKIASAVQKYIAEILLENYLDDPIISNVSIVSTDASGGLQFVKIFYYVRGGIDLKLVDKTLAEAKDNIRYVLAQKMNQKYVPDLRFIYDDTLERAQHIESLFEKIREQ